MLSPPGLRVTSLPKASGSYSYIPVTIARANGLPTLYVSSRESREEQDGRKGGEPSVFHGPYLKGEPRTGGNGSREVLTLGFEGFVGFWRV